MKKLIQAFVLCALVMLSGCSRGIINDRMDGSIHLDEKKYSYSDGTYYAYGKYTNTYGYAPAMRVVVKNNLIVSVRFDYFDKKMSAYTSVSDAGKAEEIEAFRSEIKSLNSSVLENQHYSELKPLRGKERANDYYCLIERIVHNAAEGNFEVSEVEMDYTYKAELFDANTNITSHLSVTYTKSEIANINFYQTNQEGITLKDFYNAQDVSRTYAYKDVISALNAVNEDRTTLKKDVLFDETIILKAYNSMCETIEAARRVFVPKINQMFSSR